MDKQKILVTGGLGFIGSHTVVELIEAGYEVVIIDDLSNSDIVVLDRIERITHFKPAFYQINMLDKIKLDEFFVSEKKYRSHYSFRGF